MNKQAISTIIGTLLIVIMIIASASTFYFWVYRVQSGSLATSEKFVENTLTYMITEVKLSDKPTYNTLGENRVCQPTEVVLNIQNTGARNVDINRLTTNPKTQIIIKDMTGRVVCTSDLSGTCLESGDFLYAATGNNGTFFRTPDGSTEWSATTRLDDLTILTLEKFMNAYYAGTSRNGQIFVSCNGYDWNWQANTGSEAVTDFEEFNGYLYAGTYNETAYNGKLYRTDNGLNWTNIFNFTNSNIYSIKEFNNRLYVGTGDYGKIFNSSDGVSWESVGADLGKIVYALEVFNGELYVGTSDEGKIYLLNNTDEKWHVITDTTDEAITAFVLFGGDIYAGTQNNGTGGRILKSTDGVQWNSVYATGDSDEIRINTLFVNNNFIYAGSDKGTVYRSTDGSSWSDVANDLNETVRDFINVSVCASQRVNCTSGCNSEIPPNSNRVVRLQLSNTVCDLSEYGTGNFFTFNIYFEGVTVLSGRFKKTIINRKTSSNCNKTFPVCNGNCGSGALCEPNTANNPTGCVCRTEIPSCKNADEPMCGGTCQDGTLCEYNTTYGGCVCVDWYEDYCGNKNAPTCGGDCAYPSSCINTSISGQNCECRFCLPDHTSGADTACGVDKGYSFETGEYYSDPWCINKCNLTAFDYTEECDTECLPYAGYFKTGWCYSDPQGNNLCNSCISTSTCNSACGGTGYTNDGSLTCFIDSLCNGQICGLGCARWPDCDSACGGVGWSDDGGITCYLNDPTCAVSASNCCTHQPSCYDNCFVYPSYGKGGSCYTDSSCTAEYNCGVTCGPWPDCEATCSTSPAYSDNGGLTCYDDALCTSTCGVCQSESACTARCDSGGYSVDSGVVCFSDVGCGSKSGCCNDDNTCDDYCGSGLGNLKDTYCYDTTTCGSSNDLCCSDSTDECDAQCNGHGYTNHGETCYLDSGCSDSVSCCNIDNSCDAYCSPSTGYSQSGVCYDSDVCGVGTDCCVVEGACTSRCGGPGYSNDNGLTCYSDSNCQASELCCNPDGSCDDYCGGGGTGYSDDGVCFSDNVCTISCCGLIAACQSVCDSGGYRNNASGLCYTDSGCTISLGCCNPDDSCLTYPECAAYAKNNVCYTGSTCSSICCQDWTSGCDSGCQGSGPFYSDDLGAGCYSDDTCDIGCVPT